MSFLSDLENEISEWLTSTETLRVASSGLRAWLPIAVSGDRVFVSRYDDVVAVLADDANFGVTEIYADKMARTTGTFFLGMEDTPQYRREAGIARNATRKDDADGIVDIVKTSAKELLGRARLRGGKIDAVGEFSRLVPLRLLERYFGVPGPDPDTMKRWMRAIFWDIFLNPEDDPKVRESAAVASAALRPYLAGMLDTRKKMFAAGKDTPDDFVSRLLAQQRADATIDDDLLIRNIGGVIVGAVDTQSKAIAHALDQFLRQPAALESARRAAFANDDAALRAHVREALRFNPHNPALFRHCRADTVVADGTSRRTTIKAGSTIVALTISAMFDADAVERPDEFRSDRPDRSYLHFGYGQHCCFGSRINDIVLPAIFEVLLKVDGLGYDEDGPRHIEYEGPFPDRMLLRFDTDA